jgi:hypothetical protein
LRDLISRGADVANPDAGTPADQIHQWIEEVDQLLFLLKDQFPTARSAFQQLRVHLEYMVDEEAEAQSSDSAYRPDEADVLFDFRFDYLGQTTTILRRVAAKLKAEGDTPRYVSAREFGERLRQARRLAYQSQREAADETGYDHKAFSLWERGIRMPRGATLRDLSDYIAKHSKPEKQDHPNATKTPPTSHP